MKLLILMSVLMAAAMLASPPHLQAADDSGEKVQKEIKEAWEAVGDYTYEKKEDMEMYLKARMYDLNRQIDRLQAEAKDSSGEGKERLNQAVDKLKKKRDQAADKLDQLQESSSDAWGEAKKGLKNAWGELGDAYDRVRAELSD